MSDWTHGIPRTWIRDDDPRYPERLRDLPKPPEELYILGDPAALTTPMMAIIGARRATPYGLSVAELAARTAVESDLTVISGGAAGCDSHAQHEAASAGSRVVSVAACGPDVVYPSGSESGLLALLDAGGAVVSEYPWGTRPTRWRFSERNRIIVALAQLVLIAEAALPSGTFLAANLASELSRTLVAAPGSIFSPESEGANYLLSDIATPIWNTRSLREMIALTFGTMLVRREENEAGTADTVMRSLIASPMDAERLADSLGVEAVDAIRLLSAYEADGLVTRGPDGRYAPTPASYRSLGMM